MLRAIGAAGERVLADEATRQTEAYCPECRALLVYRHGVWVVPHFAHRPDGSCGFGEGESERHLQMKTQMRSIADAVFVDYETAVVPGFRADLVLAGRVVVECQASALETSEWTRRTTAYGDAGYSVLWVWDTGRLVGVPCWSMYDGGEQRIPAEIRWHHRVAYGRLYALDGDGELWACHLARVTPRPNDWPEGPAERMPRTLRHVEVQSLPEQASLRPFVGVGGARLVSFGEKVWWR